MVFISQSGCLLPLLIMLNLFFGLFIFKPLTWLLVGIVLALLLMLNSYAASRRSFAAPRKRGNVIDVEGEVVEERHKLQ